MDDTYRIALKEANKLHQQLKVQRSITKEPKGLKPPPYVKLKVWFRILQYMIPLSLFIISHYLSLKII